MAWNGSSSDSAHPVAEQPRAPKKSRGLIALILIVLGALAAWYFLMPSAPAPKQTKKTARERLVAETAPAVVSKPFAAPSAAPTNAPDPVKTVVKHEPIQYSSNCVTRPIDPNDPDAPLVTGVNQEIGSLLSSKLGEEPTPFPYSFDNDDADNGNDAFLDSLKTKVEFREGESASRENFKRKILDSRIELIDQIKDGVSYKDSMKEAYKMRVRAYELRKSLIEGLHDIAVTENASRDEMDNQIQKVNKKLAEQGIIPIDYDSLGLEEE